LPVSFVVALPVGRRSSRCPDDVAVAVVVGVVVRR